MKSADKPFTLSTYVDDAYTIWGGDVQSFLAFVELLNSIWPNNLKFTHELSSKSRELNFLDILVKINGTAIAYELYQKPTHSGRYLHFQSHCAMKTKINIVKSEAARIIRNCSDICTAWKHLDQLRRNLMSSGYPLQMTTILILKVVNEYNAQASASSSAPKEKKHYDYILRVPYINEATTRKLRKIVENSGFDIRVVTTPGTSVKALISRGTADTHDCVCEMHQQDINCTQQYIVYEAICEHCGGRYIGASARPASERLNEHESSVRLLNSRTTLGDHIRHEHAPSISNSTTTSKGRRNYDNFFGHYNFKILRTCRDTLETFIYEGLDIAHLKPELNAMKYNGFIM